jgi:EmrB/QacA subfamily drug resistance transporter
MFLSILDVTITNLAVADLHRSFLNSSTRDFTWVISLYAILLASFLAPAGRLADVIGRRSLFTAGVGMFTVMSLLCSLAPTLSILLAARALQAIGAAAMIPASLAVVLVDSPPERRAAAIGWWAAAASAAAAAGPTIGGILIDASSWRAVFLVNVPIGIGLLIGIRRVHKSGARTSSLPDAVGTMLLATGVGLLTLGVTEGPTWHWSSVRELACLIGGAALLVLAVARSRHHAVPAIETQLWHNRTYALANVVSLFFGATLYAWMLIAALILVNVWHFSWLAAGLAMSPGALVAAVVSVLVGRILRRYNPGTVIFLGAVAIVCGAVWMILALSSQPQFLSLFLPVAVLAGLGMGAVSTGVSTAAALSVAPSQFAGATGLNVAVRQIGGALGIAALAAILPPQISSDPAPHASVILFCCVTAVVTGLVGLGLLLHTKRSAATKEVAVAPAR